MITRWGSSNAPARSGVNKTARSAMVFKNSWPNV
jgi:hypothetical protein